MSEKKNYQEAQAFSAQSVSSKAELEEWVRFPRREIYTSASHWVPPLDQDLQHMLDRKKNPFFRYGEARPLLVRDAQGKIAGRLLAHISYRHITRHNERAAFFGYFECREEVEAGRALIEAAAEFGRERDCVVLRGPFNMTAMQEMGILQSGFDEAPAVDETYTAPYYPALLEACGLQPAFPVTTFRIDDVSTVDPEILLGGERQHRLLADGHLRIRSANTRDYEREFETLRELLNDSFYQNRYFVPITREEFAFQIGPYKRLMDPTINLVAELDGVPCGFVVTVPDFNPLLKQMHGSMGPRSLWTFLRGRSHVRDAVLIIMGVQQQLQNRGIMRVLHAELIRALCRGGYRSLTITWVADENLGSLATLKALGARPLHTLSLYERTL
ncbi:MAG: GNAT family N-acetyltransferase [Ktedonobacteraceae bacterium]|nr:GNAT family N-acetyltransferase [Ktedonobacteraceae bacterium]MBO0790090.1 GNAT family N-acetyltransferase [Ktedonobacteraceae bacterium]